MKTIRFCLCLAFLALAFTLPLSAQEKDKDKAADADVAWQEFKKASRPKPFPQEWADNPPAQEVVQAEYLKRSYDALKAADLAKDFYTRFPNNAHTGEAKEQEYKLVDVAVRLGNTNVINRLTEMKRTLAYSKDTTEEMQIRLRLDIARQAAAGKMNEGLSVYLEDLEKQVRLVMKDYPDRQEPYNLLIQIISSAAQNGDVERARRLAKEVEGSKVSETAKNIVRGQMKRYEVVDKPFIFSGPSIEAQEISMEKLRGKVVLIDFWASWCGPCMAEVPNIKEIYKKYHEQGFEIIGINLDESVDALKDTIKKHGMTWPQHFDGGNPEGGWARKFGVTAIPTMWLVDKKGMLKELNAREDLASKVEKLLAEPAP